MRLFGWATWHSRGWYDNTVTTETQHLYFQCVSAPEAFSWWFLNFWLEQDMEILEPVVQVRISLCCSVSHHYSSKMAIILNSGLKCRTFYLCYSKNKTIYIRCVAAGPFFPLPILATRWMSTVTEQQCILLSPPHNQGTFRSRSIWIMTEI